MTGAPGAHFVTRVSGKFERVLIDFGRAVVN